MGKRTDPSTATLPHIIVQGNPLDGFTFTGPFAGPVTAVEYADDANLKGEWWIAPLHPPREDVVHTVTLEPYVRGRR